MVLFSLQYNKQRAELKPASMHHIHIIAAIIPTNQ